MFESYANEIFSPEGLLRPNDRRGQTEPDISLPVGTLVFSADNHVELGEDIWFERFPESLRDKAPRVFRKDSILNIRIGGEAMLPDAYLAVLEPYARVPGFDSAQLDSRLRDLDAEGVAKELAFPNTLLMLLQYPDLEVRELCFRIYNEYLAELQEKSGGRFYGVGLINWWDPAGARRTLAELKALGLRTFLMPLNAGVDADGAKIDYASSKMRGVWEAVEETGIAVAHHVGETFASPCEFNNIEVSYVHSVAPFRDMFARYICGGILDRHPTLRIGWFEGGINWLPSAMQDLEHAHASFWHMSNLELRHAPDHYWRTNMCASFVVDPLGLEMIDRIGVERVMWSADYPHIEGSFGYTRSSLNHVIAAVGRDDAPAVVGGNVCRFLQL
jgi:predicted TIM-barrel fold metal-dependent hydrolase